MCFQTHDRQPVIGCEFARNLLAHRGDRPLYLARRANHFGFTEIVSSPKIKNISLYPKANQGHIVGHPVLLRGALAIVTTRGGLRWTPMLRLTSATEAYGKVVW